MLHNLSLVHLLLALGAAATIYLVARELRGAHVSEWALFAPGIAALFVAAGLFLIQIGAGQRAGPSLPRRPSASPLAWRAA